MRAILIESEGAPRACWRPPRSLLDGEAALDVQYSSLIIEVAMALAGRGIARTYPLDPGIDLAGTVTDSTGFTA